MAQIQLVDINCLASRLHVHRLRRRVAQGLLEESVSLSGQLRRHIWFAERPTAWTNEWLRTSAGTSSSVVTRVGSWTLENSFANQCVCSHFRATRSAPKLTAGVLSGLSLLRPQHGLAGVSAEDHGAPHYSSWGYPPAAPA